MSIPLAKETNYRKDELLSLKASSYNLEGVSIKEAKLSENQIFTQDFPGGDLKKISIPEVREGSVVEVYYKIDLCDAFHLPTWNFQSSYPKKHSELTVLIPDTWHFNITLRGDLALSENETTTMEDCFSPGASCSKMQFGMTNIPVFKTEEFMTASSNFLSSIHFNLASYKSSHRSGGLNIQVIRGWKTITEALGINNRFGVQINTARESLRNSVNALLGTEKDDLRKAKQIYNYIAVNYEWNKFVGIYTQFGADKSRELKKGNCADINLSLVAALQIAKLQAVPVILSTRNHGVPNELFPLVSDYNYVIARLKINGTEYLLDCTNRLQPFGMLPIRCLNGKGYIVNDDSLFVELKPTAKFKTQRTFDLTIDENGDLTGQATIYTQGYAGFAVRSELLEAGSTGQYLEKLRKKWNGIEIDDYQTENSWKAHTVMIEKFRIKIPQNQVGERGPVYINPFIMNQLRENPFRSETRSFPIDFGAPRDEVMLLNLTLPDSYIVDEVPRSAALSLPDGGGKYLFNVTTLGNKISVISSQTMARSAYASFEYQNMREFYARLLQIRESQIVLKRK